MSRGSREKKIENPNFLSLAAVSFLCERKYTHSLGDSLNQKVLSSSLSLSIQTCFACACVKINFEALTVFVVEKVSSFPLFPKTGWFRVV
jgi:hypothetical protein